MIFVFGSNEAGVHGAGAAYVAYTNYGAVMGFCFGRKGESFAIPTKSRDIVTSLSYEQINEYVKLFIYYASIHHELAFKVTQIGCGLAGLDPEKISIMFKDAPKNCFFDEAWKPFLGNEKSYWGLFKSDYLSKRNHET